MTEQLKEQVETLIFEHGFDNVMFQTYGNEVKDDKFQELREKYIVALKELENHIGY